MLRKFGWFDSLSLIFALSEEEKLMLYFGKRLLSVSFMIGVLFALNVNASVTYIGIDKTTQGDWVGKYGKDGAVIFCNKSAHGADLSIPYVPSEAEKLFIKGLIQEISITDSTGKAYGYIWNATPGDDKKCSLLVDKSSRIAACVSGRGWADLTISLKVNSTNYKVSIYCLDYDKVRVPGQDTYGYQGDKLPDKFDINIGDHTNGVYISWEVTGQEPFKYFAKKVGATVNIVTSAVFVDEIKTTSNVDPASKLLETWGKIKQNY